MEADRGLVKRRWMGCRELGIVGGREACRWRPGMARLID